MNPKASALKCKKELSRKGIISSHEVGFRFNLVIPGRQFDSKLPTMMLCCRGSDEAVNELLFRDLKGLVFSDYLGAKPFLVIPGVINEALISLGKDYLVPIIPLAALPSFARILASAKAGSEAAISEMSMCFKQGELRFGQSADEIGELDRKHWAMALLWGRR